VTHAPGSRADSRSHLASGGGADLAHVLRSERDGTAGADVRASVVAAVEVLDLDSGARHPGAAVDVVSRCS
jgi:hypothetical protein